MDENGTSTEFRQDLLFTVRSPVRPGRSADYVQGTTYSLAAAVLLALQAPFSALAARQLSAYDFIAFTQIALVTSLPLLLARPEARRDFASILRNWKTWPKLFALLIIGIAGLLLYDVGLATAHPIITSAVLDLSPFWAATTSFIVSRKPLPVRPAIFFVCFSLAAAGAMAVAWSQIDQDPGKLATDVLESALHSHWIYALPMPIFFALSGTLVYRWFRGYNDCAAVGANFLVSALVLIPAAMVEHAVEGVHLPAESTASVMLLLIGTLASSAAGRVLYQAALTVTENDNGFVTMFFLVVPAISALASWPLSLWVPGLMFIPSPLFLSGLAFVTVSLAIFARQALGEQPYGLSNNAR